MTVALVFGTLFFAGLGAIGALVAGFVVPKDQVALIRVLAPLAAFCMWLSYALIYMAQLNPLILPTRNLKAE